MGTLLLDKFQALGNDFLVLIDPARTIALSAELANALCDRHLGVGADGLIRLSGSAEQMVMELWNADGTLAETSGNGLRCAALAVKRASGIDEFVIETAAGPAACVVRAPSGAAAEVRVEMGRALVSEEASPFASRRAFRVDVGNPHLVLIGEHGDLDIAEIGPKLEWAVPEGQNVELITAHDGSTLDLEVYERGVGLTQACGSGSVAAAAAAREAGLVGAAVTVRNPGGTLVVELDGAPPLAALTGPVRHVATLSVDLEGVGALA